MAWVGRRNAFILFSVPGILSWLLISLARDVTILMIGRVCGGLAIGGTIIAGVIIIGEYSSPKHRGMFLGFNITAICFGALIVNVLQNHWKTTAWISVVFQVLSFVITFTLPESPHWLVSKERYYEGEESFYSLRGNSIRSKREFEDLIQTQQEKSCNPSKTESFFKKFTKMSFYQPCIIMLFSFLLMESSLKHILTVYSSQIMAELGFGESGYKFEITLTLAITTLVSSVLLSLVGRRTLLLSTGLLAVSILFTTCTCILFSDSIPSSLHWFAVSMFLLYTVLVNLGCTTIPLVLLGEIFPLEHRAVGSATGGLIALVCTWSALKVFPYMLTALKLYVTLGVFGLIQLFSLFVLYFILPETKDRTLEEIEYFINVGCFRQDDCVDDKEVFKIVDGQDLLDKYY
jgi:facilitated trehalose transporter